jgi:hypothetical protein
MSSSSTFPEPLRKSRGSQGNPKPRFVGTTFDGVRPVRGKETFMAERSGGYGSRWKKWLLVYIAIGVVVYAIIYFVFIYHGSRGGSGGGLYTLFALPGPEVLRPEHRSPRLRHR